MFLRTHPGPSPPREMPHVLAGMLTCPLAAVQQVPQPAAPVVPALVADAVFQDHVVSETSAAHALPLGPSLHISDKPFQKQIKNE